MQASRTVGDDPKTDSQVEASGVKLNVATATETLSKLTNKDELQEDENASTPMLYTVISEASGEVGEAHMPDCQDKNCQGRSKEQLEAQGQREEESIDVLYNAHSLDKRETVAQIKLGRRLCSVLRFRAKCMGLPMNTDGYVPSHYCYVTQRLEVTQLGIFVTWREQIRSNDIRL